MSKYSIYLLAVIIIIIIARAHFLPILIVACEVLENCDFFLWCRETVCFEYRLRATHCELQPEWTHCILALSHTETPAHGRAIYWNKWNVYGLRRKLRTQRPQWVWHSHLVDWCLSSSINKIWLRKSNVIMHPNSADANYYVLWITIGFA